MGELIKGAEQWFLQQFKSDTGLVNKSFEGGKSYPGRTLDEMRELAKKYAKICEIR